MENKKSFILYVDSLDILDEMTDVQAGQLFKAIKSYHKGDDITLDPIVKMVFIPFKNQFLRDDGKWMEIKEKRIIAGAKGGMKKVANATKSQQNTPVSVNVNDTVIVTDNVNENVNESVTDIQHLLSSFSFDNFWNLYNKKVGLVNCQTLFDELTGDEKLLIEQRLPAYIKATENEIMYRKDPYTWLAGKHWLDEHVPLVKKSAFDLL